MPRYTSLAEFKREDPVGFERQARKFIGDGSCLQPLSPEEDARLLDRLRTEDPALHQRILALRRSRFAQPAESIPPPTEHAS